MANIGGLSINIEVIEQMAGYAALETAGVAELSPRRINVAGAVSGKPVLKPVHAEIKNGAVIISLYICVEKTVDVKKVAEAVQDGVKEKVQSMTGNAVTKVNVNVVDVKTEEETAE